MILIDYMYHCLHLMVLLVLLNHIYCHVEVNIQYITCKETKQAILHHLLLQIQEEFLVFQYIIIHLQVQTVREYSIELAHLKVNKDKAVQVLHCFSILINFYWNKFCDIFVFTHDAAVYFFWISCLVYFKCLVERILSDVIIYFLANSVA